MVLWGMATSSGRRVAILPRLRTSEDDAVKPAPGGLVDLQRRPRPRHVVGGAHWYVVEPGRFDFVGEGDVSEADLLAVAAELGGRAAVFVCVAQPKLAEDVLGRHSWGLRRLRWADRLKKPLAPRLAWVARGARVAVLPERGPVWVDGERLFSPGELVPLPWTDPLVSLVVVRPGEVLSAMRQAVGPAGPRRASGLDGD